MKLQDKTMIQTGTGLRSSVFSHFRLRQLTIRPQHSPILPKLKVLHFPNFFHHGNGTMMRFRKKLRIYIQENAIFAELTEKEIVVQQYEMAVVHIATPNE